MHYMYNIPLIIIIIIIKLHCVPFPKTPGESMYLSNAGMGIVLLLDVCFLF